MRPSWKKRLLVRIGRDLWFTLSVFAGIFFSEIVALIMLRVLPAKYFQSFYASMVAFVLILAISVATGVVIMKNLLKKGDVVWTSIENSA